MKRYYILPIQEVSTIQSTTAGQKYRGPKYLRWRENEGGLGVNWSLMDYGAENYALVLVDITTEQHDALSANSDVVSIPTNIDSNLTSGAVSVAKTKLEAMNIPADWIDTSYTYRQVLRKIVGLFQFAQRHHAKFGVKVIEKEQTLETAIGDLSKNTKNNLQKTADSFGWNFSIIKSDWKLRKVLKHLADHWGNDPIHIGGEEI